MFEGLIKCTYNPNDDSADDEYDVPLPGAADDPSIRLEDGYLGLSKSRLHIETNCRDDIDSVFKPVFQQILDLVQEQLDLVAVHGTAKVSLHNVF